MYGVYTVRELALFDFDWQWHGVGRVLCCAANGWASGGLLMRLGHLKKGC